MADNRDCVGQLEKQGVEFLLPPEQRKLLEQEIHRIMDSGVDGKTANMEFEEVLTGIIEDSRYSSIRVIEDILKQDRALERIFVDGNFKKTMGNFLNFFEGNNSVETMYRVYANKYTNQFRTELKDAGLEKDFFSGEYDELIFHEAHNRSKGLPSGNDPKVVQMFEMTKKLNNQIYADLKASGLNMKYRRDFLISRNYDSAKLLKLAGEGATRAQSKAEFIRMMRDDLLNLEESFSQTTLKGNKVDEVLGEMFEEIVASQRVFQVNDLIGKKNYTNRLRGRKLTFKDGAAEYKVHTELGQGSKLGEAMEYQIDRNAKTVANVSMLGTDPEKAFKRLANEFEKNFEGEIEKDEFFKQLDKVQRAYTEVVAPPHKPTTTVKKAINMIRGLQAFTKLGSSLFAAFWDVNSSALQHAFKTGEFQTKSYLKTIKATADVIFGQYSRKELSKILNVNTWFNDPAVVLGGHRGDFDTGFDKINRFFTTAAKFTGVPHQTEISRAVNGILQSHAFQSAIDNMDNLNNMQKLSLDEYGISIDDLKFLRDNVEIDKNIGAITSYDIMNIPLEKFDADNATAAMRMRNKLFEKHSAYIDDSVQKGTPTPTAKIKRHLGKDRGNKYSDLASLIMQFKETAWKIAVSNKEALDGYYRANGVTGAGMAVTEYMMMGLVSYSMIETLRAWAFGTETPFEKLQRGDDLRNLAFDFVNKSSVAPLLSDAVDQGTSPYFGNNITSYIAGPTLGGTLPDAFGIARSSDKVKTGRKFMNRHILPSNWIPYKAGKRLLMDYDMITGEKIRK